MKKSSSILYDTLFVSVVNVVNFQFKFCYMIVIILFNHNTCTFVYYTYYTQGVSSSYWHAFR